MHGRLTALIVAVRDCEASLDTRVIELLIAAGTDLEAKDKDGYAVCRMRPSRAVGSEPSRACGRETALIEAARTGHEHVVELLIAAGADVASADDYG